MRQKKLPFGVCQRYDGSNTRDGHQSACQVTFARHGPYFIVQRISGNAQCLVQRDARASRHENRLEEGGDFLRAEKLFLCASLQLFLNPEQ